VFHANFADPGEIGAACCVYVDGRPVVDLWGGLAGREGNRPWREEPVAQVASTTKGAAAICAHLLVRSSTRSKRCAGPRHRLLPHAGLARGGVVRPPGLWRLDRLRRPGSGVDFGYVTNLWNYRPDDPRAANLAKAVRAYLG